jgi:hypothetical protein
MSRTPGLGSSHQLFRCSRDGTATVPVTPAVNESETKTANDTVHYHHGDYTIHTDTVSEYQSAAATKSSSPHGPRPSDSWSPPHPH